MVDIMDQLSLEGGGTHPTSHLESSLAVVVFDCLGQPLDNDTGCGLPQDLH